MANQEPLTTKRPYRITFAIRDDEIQYIQRFMENRTTQENKSDNGSDQPTKSDGISGNESTNGSNGLALFSLYMLISILVNTREELYTTIISYRIPIVGPNQIRWKILH